MLHAITQILDHFSLIKDHKHTKLYQSIQKTLAKRRLSLEKETRTSASKISSAGIKGHTEEKKGLMQASLVCWLSFIVSRSRTLPLQESGYVRLLEFMFVVLALYFVVGHDICWEKANQCV